MRNPDPLHAMPDTAASGWRCEQRANVSLARYQAAAGQSGKVEEQRAYHLRNTEPKSVAIEYQP